MANHPQGSARAQASAVHDGPCHRARCGLRRRHLHPHRHHEPGLRRPVRPDRQGRRRGGERYPAVQGNRPGGTGCRPGGTGPQLRACPDRTGSRRPGGRGLADRVCAARRQERQGDHHRWGAHAGGQLDRRPATVRGHGPAGPAAGAFGRDRSGREDSVRARPARRGPGDRAAGGASHSGHHRGHLRLRLGGQPRRGHTRGVRSTDGAGRAPGGREVGHHRGRGQAGCVAQRPP